MDTQVSGSANGAPIPFGFGGFRIGCQIIWSSGIKETTTSQTQSAKGGPSQTSTTYSYTISFAAAACKGPAGVTRIWGDSKLIYDATSKGAVTSNTLATGIGTNTVQVIPAIYSGVETQQPDPTIQAKEGVNATSAMRDLCYFVYENLPLAAFGNRLPNLRAEVSTGVTNAYLKDIYPSSGVTDPYAGTGPGIFAPRYPFVDTARRCAYIFDSIGMVVQKIDLSANNTGPLDSWQPSFVYAIGQQILDSNGNVQTCTAVTSDDKSGTVQPTWTHVEGDILTDHNVHWTNTAAGPEAVVVTGKGLINPSLHTGSTYSTNSTLPYTLGVDTNGYLWITGALSPAVSGQTNFAIKIDPSTFVAVGYVPTGVPLQSCQFVKTSDGQDLAYFLTNTGFGSAGGKVIVVDVHTLKVKNAGVPFLVNGGPATTGFDAPAIAPNGIAYGITYGSSGAWAINTIDARFGGHGLSSTNFTEPLVGGSADEARSCLYYGADHSLLVFTRLGAVHKVDIATMTISNSLVAGTLASGGNYADQISKAYPGGQVPSDGFIHLIGPTISGRESMLTFNASTLAVESTVSLSSWSSILHTIDNFGYDPNTVSMLITDGGMYSFRLYLNRQAVAGETLDLVVADLFQKSGLTSDKYDTSALSGIVVRGYPVTRIGDAKSNLSVLCQAYFFDIVESDFKLKCVLRGGSTSATIPESDLGIADTNGQSYELQTTIAQQQDLPKDITVLYSDPAMDYQQGKQMRRRHSKVVKTKNQTLLELPLTLQSDEAAQIAQKALSTLWSERNQYAWKLWKAVYQIIDPSDLVQFTYGSAPYQSRITKTNVGQNRQIEVSGASENSLTYVSTIAGISGTGVPTQTLGLPAITTLFLLDLPLLQDTDSNGNSNTGFYWAMSSPNVGWSGGVLFSSSDNENFSQLDFSNTEIPYGVVSVKTPAPRSAFSWDYTTTITVRMVKGTLSSTTALNVLNGANGFVLGNEVMQFQNATMNGDGTYTLSNLLRGRRGTEWACNLHQPGETFILLNGTGLHKMSTQLSLINALRYVKGVTVGQPITSAYPQQFTQQGNDLKPYAPAQFQGVRDASGNFSVSWQRRTRIGGAWMDGTGTVPLSEDSESYDVEVMQLRGNGVSPFPNYSVSPASPCFGTLRLFGGGGGSILEGVVGINPCTVTFEDGSTASYTGVAFPDVDSIVSFGTTVYVSISDPTHAGDNTGNPLLYHLSTSPDAYANIPGNVFLGTVSIPGPGLGEPIVTPGGTYNVVRSVLGLNTPSWTYPFGLVTADFGSTVNSLRVRVYQNSAQVGRGFVAQNDAMGVGVGSIGGSSDATSLQGVAIGTTAPTDGQVLTYVSANHDAEWKTPGGSIRASVNKTSGSLAMNASETGMMTMGCKSFVVLGASTTRQCRIQLYSTAALRDADAGRAIGTNPTDGTESGVIMDLVLTSLTTWIATPAVLGANMETSPTQTIAYRITNLDTTTGTVPITLTVLPLES
jgi:hypothetical protein